MGHRVALIQVEPEIKNLLADCEAKIETCLSEAHYALRRIQEEKLYRAAGYKSFESYVAERWGYSKTHAYRLIDHTKFLDHLKEQHVHVLPASEGVSRPLMKLKRLAKSDDDFMQRAENAWQIAVDKAPKVLDVPQITPEHVEATMAHYGIYRPAKRKNTSEEATKLRELLTKLGQCGALKMSPEVFMNRFEGKGFPNNFQTTLSWLMGCAELGAGPGD